MKKNRLLIVVVLTALLIVMFVKILGNKPTVTDGPQPLLNNLPLLNEGKHMFIWKGLTDWESLSTITRVHLNTKYKAAIDAGMDIGLVHLDWSQLETADGVFDKNLFKSKLDECTSNNQQPFVTICTLDSEGYSVPAYLRDPSDPGKLRSDIQHMNNPEFLSKWYRLLDWVIPMILEHDGFMISVGNEVDNKWRDIYEENGGGTDGKAAANIETQHIKAFVDSSRTYIRSLPNAEDLAVSVTITKTAAMYYYYDNTFYPCIPEYISVSDCVVWNYYGQYDEGMRTGDWSKDFAVEEPSSVPETINILKELSDGKEMIIQEAGFPASPDNNSSEQLQKEWFDALYSAFHNEPSLRILGIFMMVDPDYTAMQTYVLPYIEDLDEPWKSRISGMYRSYGFNRLSDGSSKLAWEPFIAELERLIAENNKQ